MIRGWLCLVVILLANALASPFPLTSSHEALLGANPVGALPPSDPLNITAQGALSAFNYTLSSANIFTNATALATPSTSGNAQFKWFSTINATKTGQPVAGSAFNYTLNPTPNAGRQEINWTMTIPSSSCSGCHTYVSFTLFGNLTAGTSLNFTLTNSTIPVTSGIFRGNQTAELPICTLATFSNSTVCGPTVKILVDKFVKSTLQLSFRFGWNSTSEILKASVGEVLVESLDTTIKSSFTNSMTQSTGNNVKHSATLFPVSYNTTNSVRPWSNEVLNIYYPSGYDVTQLQLNQTSGSPITIFSSASTPPAPFEHTRCDNGSLCSRSLIAVNMSDIQPVAIRNSTIYITALTKNSIQLLSTLSGGIATEFFTSGDEIGIKVVNHPSIANSSTTLQTGTLSISFSPELFIPNSTQIASTGGVYNFTLPSGCGSSSLPCQKNVSAVFISSYDIGNMTISFRIDLLEVKSFSGTGGNNALSIQGALEYGNGSVASDVNATLFAVDRGTTVNRPITTYQTTTLSSNLYISNVTLVNGVFAQGQSLTMLFTIINPNATQAFNATVTIEHEWPGPQSHNMTASLFLGLGDKMGDFAFATGSARTYKATITFTGAGVQVVVTSLATGNPIPNPLVMTEGTSPVVPNRPHAGLFRITVTSKINNATESASSSILSPTYAYVPPSLVPSRYLYGSPVFLTKTDGSFAQTISNNTLLGAENLTVFILARNSFGIVVVNSLPSSGYSDSTTLIPTTDTLGPVAKGQSATATLHLKSNSTQSNGITQVITVQLTISGNGLSTPLTVTSGPVTISPGASVTVPITFTAPPTVGSYTITYFSPEYGGVLTSQTLQVTILQSNLQFLIPAGIGVAAAIVVLGFYLIKGRPSTDEESEETTKTKGPTTKPKSTPSGNATTKSLTRTEDSGK